ncbi:MAG: helix-turn-helix transcriptional regulator [Oscillibacter sp.]|jgi:transcriptional regulator with XRE-family HTH domain|nr:helix-turn-helix transcriptional regulator [Oscillibacter sp.]
MVSMIQRMEQLRTERGLSRPALAAALGFPRMAVEKFETGRQTPSQEQQEKLANYFGVSLFYLRGESDDPTRQTTWMDEAYTEVEAAPMIRKRVQAAAPAVTEAASGEGNMLDAFLTSKKFKEALHAAVLDTLKSPEGQELLIKVVRKELGKR